MAFPWTFEDDFESGDNSGWTSETDTASQLDFPHYSELARFPWSNATPYNGAYCMRATLSGGTADAFVRADSIDIALAGNAFFKFNVWFSPTFTGTADDTFNLFEAQSTSSAVEVACSARIVAATNVINIGIGETAATSWSTLQIERNVWYTIELDVTVDNDANDDGTIDLYITREGDPSQATVSATQVGSLDQLAVTHGVLGPQNHLATTTGVILYDGFVMDGTTATIARVHPIERFRRRPVMTKSGHVFVGPGWLDGTALLTDESANALRLWDTDEADTNGSQGYAVSLDVDNQTSFGGPAFFQNGCYMELSGTAPLGEAFFNATTGGEYYGPLYHSRANMRRLGLLRT